ncbi:hypothetical protein AKJ16_DCAP21837 [Drosera capensis]
MPSSGGYQAKVVATGILCPVSLIMYWFWVNHFHQVKHVNTVVGPGLYGICFVMLVIAKLSGFHALGLSSRSLQE